jgi:hypothetical protein
MGFVSLTEDIIKRHEADVHELIRALESGEVSETRQARALPEMRDLVTRLEKLLLDPKQPFAMQFLQLRQLEQTQAFELKRLSESKDVLGRKNDELNSQNLVLKKSVKRLESERSQARSREASARVEVAELKAVIQRMKAERAAEQERYKQFETTVMANLVDRRL